MRRFNYLCFFILFISSACSVDEVDPEQVNTGYNYFPLEYGTTWIYDVYEIKYRLTENDTLDYFLKVDIVDTFHIGKEKTYVAERKKSSTPDGPWQMDSIWSFKRNPTQAVVTENSIRYIHLVFPFEEEKSFDRNALNNKPEATYIISDVRKPYEIPGQEDRFQETVTATLEFQDNIITTKDKYVVYAKHTGLIHRYELSTEQQPGQPPYGYLLDQKLIHYAP